MADKRGNKTSLHRRDQPNQQKPKKVEQNYEPYWTRSQVQEAMKSGQVIVGPLALKNYMVACVPGPDNTKEILIEGLFERNRALDGDLVVVQIYPKQKWRVWLKDYKKHQQSLGAATVASNDDQPALNLDPGDVEVVQDQLTRQSRQASINRVSSASSQRSSASSRKSLETDTSQQELARSPTAQKEKKKNNSFASVEELYANGTNADREFLLGGLDGFSFVQKTGKVVAIQELRNPRKFFGHLKPNEKNSSWPFFETCDPNMPNFIIRAENCPREFINRPSAFTKKLYIAKILSWEETSKLPNAKINTTVGTLGELHTYNETLILLSNIDDSEATDEVRRSLPSPSWTVPESEVANRFDLRKLCVFSIDPKDSEDLDDALSIESLDTGLYQVGVHVADVGFFVKEGTELDKFASSRSSSVNLVQKVIPMLPPVLSEDLCSLHAGKDRLAVSVFWNMDEKGEVYGVEFGRTVIRSCVTLTYEDAEKLIQPSTRREHQSRVPTITNSWQLTDVQKRLRLLNKIAQHLRKKRIDAGALLMDSDKLNFSLHQATGLPIECSVSQGLDSNRLVQEFMVLANKTVSDRIETTFPGRSILRQQSPPLPDKLEALEKCFAEFGFQISESPTAKDIQTFLTTCKGSDQYSEIRYQALIARIVKIFQGSKYICSGASAREELPHYSMNLPQYTTFTSPIRRYPDLLVHRLLVASLDRSAETTSLHKKSPQELQDLADVCNERQKSINKLQRKNEQLYVSLLIKEKGSMEELGVVLSIKNDNISIFIIRFNITVTVNQGKDEKQGCQPDVEVFSLVMCTVSVTEEKQRCSCVTRRPTAVIKKEIAKLSNLQL